MAKCSRREMRNVERRRGTRGHAASPGASPAFGSVRAESAMAACRFPRRALARTSRSASTNKGIEPYTTPHGVKIDPMNNPVVASAARNGQMLGSGNSGGDPAGVEDVRHQNIAHVACEGRRRQADSVDSSQSGSRPATVGGYTKLQFGGGDDVAHSSVPASHGLSPASSPADRLTIALYTKTATAMQHQHGAGARDADSACPTRSRRVGVDAARHALQPENVHREERQVEADEEQPEVASCRAARSSCGR